LIGVVLNVRNDKQGGILLHQLRSQVGGGFTCVAVGARADGIVGSGFTFLYGGTPDDALQVLARRGDVTHVLFLERYYLYVVRKFGYEKYFMKHLSSVVSKHPGLDFLMLPCQDRKTGLLNYCYDFVYPERTDVEEMLESPLAYALMSVNLLKDVRLCQARADIGLNVGRKTAEGSYEADCLHGTLALAPIPDGLI
jgi:hypothetical protein